MPDFIPVFDSPQTEATALTAYNAVLHHWPKPLIEHDIQTRFGLTHVVDSGPPDAFPVILLHGLFASAMSWYRLAPSLATMYRVLAIDVVGEANRSRPTIPITSLDEYLAWFTELTDYLGVKHFHLVGNSFGAFTATYYAMHLPDRVRTLTLIGPAATFAKMPQFYLHMFLRKLFHLLFPWMPGRERMMHNACRWMHAGLPVDGLWDKLFIRLMMYGRMTSQVMPRVYSAQQLSRIQAPTLLLLGDRERIYTLRDAIDAAKLLMPGIRTEIIADAHHVSVVANPEAVSTRLLTFFQGNSTN